MKPVLKVAELRGALYDHTNTPEGEHGAHFSVVEIKFKRVSDLPEDAQQRVLPNPNLRPCIYFSSSLSSLLPPCLSREIESVHCRGVQWEREIILSRLHA